MDASEMKWFTHIFTRNWSFGPYVSDQWIPGRRIVAIKNFLNHLPQFTVWWGLGGDNQYDVEWEETGKIKTTMSFWGPNNGHAGFFLSCGWKIAWWREAFHFFGGVLISILSIPVILISPDCYWPFIIPLLTLFIVVRTEFTDGEGNRSGMTIKEVIDALMWTIGAAVIPVINLVVS